MRKVSTSAQPHQYYHQRQPIQQDMLRDGEKLSADQIREFLHESRQNSESSNFDETIKNQQKMEKIMLKQTFLEANQLFDPIEYFGGLKVNDLNLKVDDSRLSDMFKMKGEEQGTEKEDIISYHIKNVQQALMQKKIGQVQNSSELHSDPKMKAYHFNQNQQQGTTSLLGYSAIPQKAFVKPSAQQLQNKKINSQSIMSSQDKENLIGMNGQLNSFKKQNPLQQSNSVLGSPTNIKKNQTSLMNSLNQSQIFENQSQQQQQQPPFQNQMPLQQQNQNKQNMQVLQQSQQMNLQNQMQNSIVDTSIHKQNNDLMISPEQIQKQKNTSQAVQQGNGNPLFFSFQQNGGLQNGLVTQFDNKSNNIENSKAINKNLIPMPANSGHIQSNSATPSKTNISTKDVKIACIPNDTSPSSHQVVTSKPLMKKEGVLNRMQLLQAVEQINIESQRKGGDTNSALTTSSKTITPSSKVLSITKQDSSKLNLNQIKQQTSQLNGVSVNSSLIQQNSSYESTPTPVQKNTMNTFSQAASAQSNMQDNQSNQYNQLYQQNNNNSQIAIVQDYQPTQQKLENIEFYDQSNWQSVQQTSQHMQSIENGFGLSVSNQYNQTFVSQSAAFQDHLQSQDKFNHLQDSITSQQFNGGGGLGLIKSSLHHRSQSKMFEQKLNSEQFFKDKENLELTFQEDTANNEEELEAEFNYHPNQSIDPNNLLFSKQYQSEAHQSPQSKMNNGYPPSSRYITNKPTILNNGLNVYQGQSSLSEIASSEQQNQSNISTNGQMKKLKEKSKSMLQGDLLSAVNQKPNLMQQTSRNNSKESSQKKNNYFVQRQMNISSSSSRMKQFNSMNIPQKQLVSATSQSRLNREKDNSQIGRQNYSSYNNSKIGSSIMQNEKSMISCDKSQLTNTSALHTTTNLNKSNIHEKQTSNAKNTSQSYHSSVLGNLGNSKLIPHQKKNSVQATHNTFLSPKTSSRNTPRSVSQYTSIDYNNSNQNFYTAAAPTPQNQPSQQTNQHYINNKSQPNLCIQPQLNQTVANSILSKIGNGGSQNTINNSSQISNIANSTCNFINGSMANNNSSTYLKRPQGKSVHYDYRGLANPTTNNYNNSSKPRLIQSPTNSPSSYKVRNTPQNNQQQTIRQKKLMHRLECANTSKNISQMPSFRDQLTNNSNIQGYTGINSGSNSTKISSYANSNNLLQSLTVSSSKYGGNQGEQIDRDLKYNIALESRKQSLKVDSKYEDTLNHLVSMQQRIQNTSISQNHQNSTQQQQQQGSSLNVISSITNIQQNNTNNNPIKSSSSNLNYQKGTPFQSQHQTIFS